MRKPKRHKLIRQDLEGLLHKYERRIQKLAEEAYRVRQAMETLDKIIEKPTPSAAMDIQDPNVHTDEVLKIATETIGEK